MGKEVKSYEEFVEYLRRKDERIKMERLPFQGRNVVLYTPNVAVLLSWLLDFCYRGFSSLSWQFDFAIVAFRSLSWLLPAIVAFSLMQSNDRSAKLY